MDDTWQLLNKNTEYTFFTHNSASRIDRIYISRNLRSNLRTAHTVSVSFSDHKAYTVRLGIPSNDETIIKHRLWTFKKHTINEEIVNEFREKWITWTRQKKYYRTWLDWWVMFVKPKIISFFKWKNSIHVKQFNATYASLEKELDESYNKFLGNIKERININKIKGTMLALQKKITEYYIRPSNTYIAGENMSTIHLNERRKKRTVINTIQDNNRTIETLIEIQKYLLNHFQTLLAEEDSPNTKNFPCKNKIPINCNFNNSLCKEITTQEIYNAIKKSPHNRSPGKDGLSNEFYAIFFDIIHKELNLIINDVLEKDIPSDFTEGLIVLVRKQGQNENSIDALRPITLLNSDFKIFNRIQKARLEVVLQEHAVLTSSQ